MSERSLLASEGPSIKYTALRVVGGCRAQRYEALHGIWPHTYNTSWGVEWGCLSKNERNFVGGGGGGGGGGGARVYGQALRSVWASVTGGWVAKTLKKSVTYFMDGH